ncbi:MAG: Asp-tRNA(Asn)/Glu-tRNA(Gln) amidotransferase subunit GatB [Kiritimatiellae bacterium]|nr:Asp-tRNA(Asn)/Glu-tRNA(Gln) amidotransferase subunit GatB [Kiritimatiellia bacterium]
MNYKVTIGLETHVQLKTNTKVWCSCANVYGHPPNTDICLICLGYPGSLPVLNKEAVRLTVMTGLMLGCNINTYSKFDRKSYFYPDMPKNYQISQYDKPFCEGGGVEIDVDGDRKRVSLTRIHLEEDVGKNIHHESASLIDFNRAGTPLMEIVTEPDMESADEVFAYLLALKQILTYGAVSDCNLEQGNIRCDVNCSVRPADQKELGTKTEIKNMNTFKGVYRALKHEIQRQIDVVEKGGVIHQEARRWDDLAGVTTAMRPKEYAHDYRYLPDPDLMSVVLSDEQVSKWREALPELPAARRSRLVAEYNIPEYDAKVLAADKAIADYYEEAARLSDHPKVVSNWIMTEVLRALSEHDRGIQQIKISPQYLVDLVKLVDDKTINMPSAKEVFNQMFETGENPSTIVEHKGLVQVSDTDAIDALIVQVLEEHPQSVGDYRNGKKNAAQFLVGQVMRLSKGKANPQIAMEAIQKKLNS